MALLTPWMILLFSAIFDFGMYANALIMTENAARTAALHTSINSDAAQDSVLACSVVLQHMKAASNLKGVTSCDKDPLRVSVSTGTDTEGFLTSRVTVNYQTTQLIPLPYMRGKVNVNRSAQMRVMP
ncbi:MAG: TadE family protein [Bryobacteraceae bacterium]